MTSHTWPAYQAKLVAACVSPCHMTVDGLAGPEIVEPGQKER
jgi:hypothetical protein